MLQFLENAFYAITKTRIHVAAIFFFLMIFLAKLYGGVKEVHLVVPLAFSIWIFALYLFDRAYDINKDAVADLKDTFGSKFGKPLVILSVLIALLPWVILWTNEQSILPAIILIPITFLYSFPIHGNTRLKNIFIVKNLYSAVLIYTLPIFLVIYFYHNNSTSVGIIELGTNLFYLTLFVFTGEIIWDIKDIEADKKHGVKTFPSTYGLEKTRILVLTLLITICLYAFYFGKGINIPVTIGFVLFILLVKKNTPIWVYHLPLFIILFFQTKKFFGW